MNNTNEFLLNAEIAFANRQYPEALHWYQKVLEETPEDLYALSRAGAICVPLGKFEEALQYFGKAWELDPENGDNAFNFGNAYFFRNDYGKALELYVAAEKAGCSEDVTPRLYYQMALLCSIRQDIKASLIYFDKCEQADKTGVMGLNPDLISEKLKLYMLLQDYANAEKCAAALVAVDPVAFKNYMVYFSILMAHKDYDTAEKVLQGAKSYAALTENDRFSLPLQMASLYTAKAESAADPAGCYNKAVELLLTCKAEESLTQEQQVQLLLALAEVYSKSEAYDKAISVLQGVLSGKWEEKAPAAPAEVPGELTWDTLEAMLLADMAAIQEKIDAGELDGDMGLYAEVDYDEEGNPIRIYEEGVFGTPDSAAPAGDVQIPEPEAGYDLPRALREKALFDLLTCYLAKDRFDKARKLAQVLSHSENKYYSYYGLYSAALAERKLTGNSESTQRKYAEAIAFFRNKTFADATDTLASVFRARLYAEEGKYGKAEEIACLLAEADREAVLQYIGTCRQ